MSESVALERGCETHGPNHMTREGERVLCLRCHPERQFEMASFWASAPPEFAERFIENINLLLVSEGRAVGRLLDWIGVAELEPQSERVAVLCAEFASRTKQMPFAIALAQAREIARDDV